MTSEAVPLPPHTSNTHTNAHTAYMHMSTHKCTYNTTHTYTGTLMNTHGTHKYIH